MADDPTQQTPTQPTEPLEEKPEEKKEEPTPAEPENPNPSVPPEPSTPSTQETPLETSTENPPPTEEQPKVPEPQPENPSQQPQSPESSKPEEVKPPEEKPSEESPQPLKPPGQEVKAIDVEEKIQERLKTEQDERRKLANEARAKKKEDNLSRILEFSKEKKIFSNDDIRDLLHVSQSTATNYLSELTRRGSIKREGKRGGAKYSA